MGFRSFLAIWLAFCLAFLGGVRASTSQNCTLTIHDASFEPDIILRISSQQRTITGFTQSVPLVNGTYPGPKIELTAGQTTWIRVYNDMQGENLTMVGVSRVLYKCLVRLT